MKVPVYSTISEPAKMLWVPERAVLVNAMTALVAFTFTGPYIGGSLLMGGASGAIILFGGHFALMKASASEPNLVGQFMAGTYHRRPRPSLNSDPEWVDYVP
jgi:hypothetical protein